MMRIARSITPSQVEVIRYIRLDVQVCNEFMIFPTQDGSSFSYELQTSNYSIRKIDKLCLIQIATVCIYVISRKI